jgi:hypothetical protein
MRRDSLEAVGSPPFLSFNMSSRTELLSSLPSGTPISFCLGKGHAKREYEAVWTDSKLHWNGQSYATTGKLFKAVAAFHYGDDKKHTFDVLNNFFFMENDVKKPLKDLKAPLPPRTGAFDWLVRVGDGANFWNSAALHIWSANSKNSRNINFLKTVAAGDRLWFITKESKGHAVAVATYVSSTKRPEHDLLGLCVGNEKAGWTGEKAEKVDTEISYKDLYDIRDLKLLTNCKDMFSYVRADDPASRCNIPLPAEYANICKYASVAKVLPKAISLPSDLALLAPAMA